MDFRGIKTLKDFDFKGKRVFLRAGFDVPVDAYGNVLNDFRIKQSLPTIKELFKLGAKQIIIGSHQGRPKGKDPKYTLEKVAEKIYSLTSRPTELFKEFLDEREEIPDSAIVLLENLRYYSEEENNDKEFAKKIARFADIYVNDAYSVCHRRHASMHAICEFLPGCVGLLVEKEMKVFDFVLNNPEKPFVAIIGGAKFETKLPIIQNLLDRVDKIILGGAQIFTFYKARGIYVGKSLVDKNFVTMAQMLNNNEKLFLPTDIVIAEEPMSTGNIFNVTPDKIPSYMMGLDVGKESVEKIKDILLSAKTVVWNGPLGYYENPEFAKATIKILKFLSINPHIKTILGGGDITSVVDKLGLTNKFYHVSTGGGSSLTLLQGKDLVALDALKNWNN